MRRRMGETVAELLARDDVLGRVEELRGITSRTQHPCTHQAWRPSGEPRGGVAAAELRVGEVGELQLLEQQLLSEVEMLEEQLEAAARREQRNKEVLVAKEQLLEQLADRLEVEEA